MKKNKISLAKPNIQEADILRLQNVLKSGNLVQGKEVEFIESKICSYLYSDFASMVASGTASLHIALKVLDIGIGDEVIIPAFSFIATANVIELVGATPVFVDINIDTFNIDEKKIEEKISAKTKAIMPVHEFGLCANMPEILKIAKKHSLYVIEDAACALGAKINNKFAGTFGDFGSFSFHPRKAITSGEGGCIITNNKIYNKQIKTLRNHGIEHGNAPINFIEAGFNYRMTDFQASLLNGQLNRLEDIIEKRNVYANIYSNKIKNQNIKLPTIPKNYNHTWQTYHLLLKDESTRNKLMVYLLGNGVQSNYGAQCMPCMTYYKNKYKHNSEIKFPNAYKAYSCGLAIPLYENLSIEEVEYIINLLNKF